MAVISVWLLPLLAAVMVIVLLLDRADAKKTNIVVVLTDDLGYTDVEYNNHDPHSGARTPFLNEMASSPGVLQLSNFHSASTTCSPTRSSMISGRDPDRECVSGVNYKNYKPGQVYSDTFPFRDDMSSIAFNAKMAGYETAFFGKWHIGPFPNRSPGTMGFKYWMSSLTNVPTYDPGCFEIERACQMNCLNNPAEYQCHKVAGGCTSVYAAQNCYSGHMMPARQFNGLDPFLYEPTTANVRPANLSRGLMTADILVERFETFARGVPVDKPIFAYLFFYEVHYPFIASPEIAQLCMDGIACKKNYSEVTAEVDYNGVVYAVDRAMGRLRAFLKEIDRANDTILVLASDNGPITGSTVDDSDAGFIGYKGGIDEGSHRVPGLIEWPARITVNAGVSALTSTLDLNPTFIDLFLLEDPTLNFSSLNARPLDGTSLLPLLLAGDSLNATVDWERPQGLGICQPIFDPKAIVCPQFAYMVGSWRLVGQRRVSASLYTPKTLRLYNVETDPKQKINLAMSRPDIFNAMVGPAAQWVASVVAENKQNC